MDENEYQAFENEQMSVETDIVPASSQLEALLPIIAAPEDVSFPQEAETTVVEELEQKRDDYIPITTSDDLPGTRKIESTGVECSALCGEQCSTIITSDHATRTEKVRLATYISLTNTSLSHSLFASYRNPNRLVYASGHSSAKSVSHFVIYDSYCGPPPHFPWSRAILTQLGSLS